MAAFDLSTFVTYATGVAMIVGILGSIIPLLPGVGLQLVALVVWTAVIRDMPAFLVVAWALTVIAVGTWWQWRHPSSRAGGPDTRMMISCGIGAIVGGIIVPVVGIVLGLCAGAVIDQRLRGTPTREALRRIPTAIRLLLRYKMIEFAQSLLIAVGFEIAVLVMYRGQIV